MSSGSHVKRSTSLTNSDSDTVFAIDARYTPIKIIGTGAYGVVCSARDNKTQQKVAIKKISKAFDIVTISKRTLLEIKLLRHFYKHDNVIAIENILQPPPLPSPFNDVYVVMELLESDLHRIIYSKQELTEEHIRYFLYQILRGLKFIHSANVLHRDIKPGNLLLTSTCDLKICDFGMARGISASPKEHAGFMTAYVATRWYRAPEVMLSFRQYTFTIDVWSVACIFAEMLGRQHLFPGKNYVDQLNLVLKYLGIPNEDCIGRIGSAKAQKYLRALKPIAPPPLRQVFPNAAPVALDLLAKMMKFDPLERISVTDALAHPFLSQYHDPTDEPTCPPFEFDFEGNNTMEAAELRENIVQEIKKYEPTTRKSYAPATPTGTPSLLPRPGTYAPHQPLMGGSPTASLISPASGQPYQYDTATGERGGKRRRSDGPLGPAGVGAFLQPKASTVTFDPYAGQALSQGPPGALLNQQYAASPSSPLVAGQITAGTRPAQMYGAAPGAAGFSLLPPQGGALLQPQQQQQQQQQLPQGMSLLPGMPGYTPAGAATATAPALAPVAAVPTLATTLPGPLPGPLNTAAAAEGPGGSLSSFADELLGVGGGGGGGGLDHQWLEDIDPSWLDPSSGFDAELEMGVPEIFNAS